MLEKSGTEKADKVGLLPKLLFEKSTVVASTTASTITRTATSN